MGKFSEEGHEYMDKTLKTEPVDVPVRVRYADTDKMGIVYYGTYPIYFEIGRSEYMRKKGFSYRNFEEEGYHLVVVNLEAKYYNSATYDDLLIVRTSISGLKSRGLTFHYEVYKDGTLVVDGKTKHICINHERKSSAMPPHLLKTLKDVEST
jgi:acyl-CoA thioester hydrolase